MKELFENTNCEKTMDYEYIGIQVIVNTLCIIRFCEMSKTE